MTFTYSMQRLVSASAYSIRNPSGSRTRHARLSSGFLVCGREVLLNKIYPDPVSSLADVLRNDMIIMSGGFGLCGIPMSLIEAIKLV